MTSSKNYTEVIIDGKVFTLSGFESEEYLQQVSTYLNHKISECASSEGYGRQSAETRNILLALNIADDYFKEKKQSIALESDVEEKDKEMYDLKHELISTQIKFENLERDLEKEKNSMDAFLESYKKAIVDEKATAADENCEVGSRDEES
jgi:cell division protein ZapA